MENKSDFIIISESKMIFMLFTGRSGWKKYFTEVSKRARGSIKPENLGEIHFYPSPSK